MSDKPNKLSRVFAEHDAPQHCGKREVHDGLRPVAALVARMQKQMIEYRAALTDAMLEDDTGRAKIEHFHQTIGAAEREISALSESARNTAKIFTQLDRYVAEHRARVEE